MTLSSPFSMADNACLTATGICHTLDDMKKVARISARITLSASDKLKRIIEATNSNMSETIEKAIDLYFAEAVKRSPGSWKQLEKMGFIGCGEGPADLSTNYKKYFLDGIEKKV